MSRTPFSSLMSAITARSDGFEIDLPDDWLQGRTAYGGLSAALAHEATLHGVADLPPLRSAQFAFVGPATGRLRIVPQILRRGKSAVFVGADVTGENGVAMRGLLCFGARRDSSISYLSLPAPAVAAPDACPEYFATLNRPAASFHFDARLAGGARPRSSSTDPSMFVWLRHHDTAARTMMSGLLVLADAPPPAAMTMFPEGQAAISTMTWSLDLLTDTPVSASGWWLMRNIARSATDGYSVQDMTLWNDRGEPAIAMRQTVAIFI